MNLSWYIARRYLVSKKRTNAVNWITRISMLGVAVCTAALFIILSVFNGFEGLLLDLYGAFDPDIRIRPAIGKTFSTDSLDLGALRHDDRVAHYSEVLEEKAILRYRQREYVATIRGVDTSFRSLTGLDSLMWQGRFFTADDDQDLAVLGKGVSYYLGMGLQDMYNPLYLYIPKPGATMSTRPEDAFRISGLFPIGIFSVQADFDGEYVLVPISFMRGVLQADPPEVSALEFRCTSDRAMEELSDEWAQLLGDDYIVENRFELHSVFYKVMQTEKWAVFGIFAFIVLIATFNLIGSITMLMLEKKQDIATFRSMGVQGSTIRRIFFAEGLLINGLGAAIGLTLGILLCWGQITFGWVRLGASGAFIIDAYPVHMSGMDALVTVAMVLVIGSIASYLPVRQLAKNS